MAAAQLPHFGGGKSLRLTELLVIWNINDKKWTRPTWATSNGPFSVIHLELSGWSMSGLNVLVDREGTKVKLTDFSPKAIQPMLVKDHHAQMYQELAKDLEAKGSIALEPIKRLAAAKKLSAQKQGLLRACATGASWIHAR